jgi:hypothetical protein
MLHAICQASIGKKLSRMISCFFQCRFAYSQRRFHDILDGGEMWEEPEVLKHHAYSPPHRFQGTCIVCLQLMAANADRARIEGVKSIHTTEQGGLASARRAQQAHGLAVFDVERDTIEDGFAIVPLGEL